ncbi:hypothetical protein [Lentilactobacillus sp. Marseille-Q4993]|uniref:hypothetical protein n=1 Tax=Lentilactobacillus sp. Marseille-Q4993 TaxID=3039492 RepID=UPI0024BD480E|nr:hypothetical protein [Lentilactobacillus sp. Marseille-Q4993]
MDIQKNKLTDNNFTDDFFEPGHLVVKMKETAIAIVGWLSVLIPVGIIIVIVNQGELDFGTLRIPFHELITFFEALIILLVSIFIMVGFFSISMAMIQRRRKKRILEVWPTFDPQNQEEIKNKLSQFADQKFGNDEFRTNIKHYRVRPSQNILDDELQRIVKDASLEGRK